MDLVQDSHRSPNSQIRRYQTHFDRRSREGRSAALDEMRDVAAEEGLYGNADAVSEYLRGLGRG